MKLIGTIVPGDQVFEVEANTKRVARYAATETGHLAKLTIYCDGKGSGQGDQVARGVVYDSGGSLLALGDEIVVHDGQEADWVDLPFSMLPEGVPLVKDLKYDFGYLAGQNDKSMRVYGRTSTGV